MGTKSLKLKSSGKMVMDQTNKQYCPSQNAESEFVMRHEMNVTKLHAV